MRSTRNSPSPDENDTRYGIDDWAKVWRAAASQALDVMAENGDPNLVEIASTHHQKGPVTLYVFLRGLTRRICEITSEKDDRFQPEQFWQFAKVVHRWCCGYRAPSDFVDARSALDIALVEINRITRTERRQKGPARSEKAGSSWNVDVEICETLKAVGHRLTTIELLSEMSVRYSAVSDSTVKKRLAEMVRDKRLTNDPKARPRGYGLREWDGSLGS